MTDICPEDYTIIGDECFVFSKIKGNWNFAQEACKEEGDILAVPSDMQSFLDYIESQGPVYGQRRFFIGGKRDSGSDWTWHSKDEIIFSKEYWNKNHLHSMPSLSVSECTTVQHGSKGLKKWFCSNNFRYICQKPVIQETSSSDEWCTISSVDIFLITLILILLLLIFGLIVYAFVVKKRLQTSLSADKEYALPKKSPVRQDSKNSLYGQLL
ncbi:unnamed protein product, partial [Meganyctiphanes norvegica]